MIRADVSHWVSFQRLYVSMTVLVLLIFFHTLSYAQEIYNDQELYEKGYAAYEEDNFMQASIFLFAYVQRRPTRMEDDARHKNQVISALDYAMGDRYYPGAGARGDSAPKPKPRLDRIVESKPGTEREPICKGERNYSTLCNLLVANRWEDARKWTWNWLVAKGDKNGDRRLDYYENDNFPCSDLRTLAQLWEKYYGSQSGYDDILIPRFHNRFVSCKLWVRR